MINQIVYIAFLIGIPSFVIIALNKLERIENLLEQHIQIHLEEESRT